MADPYALVATALSMTALAAFAAGGEAQHRARPYAIGVSAHDSAPAPIIRVEPTEPTPTVVFTNPPRVLSDEARQAILGRARQEVERGVKYESTYRLLPSYPNGDIPADRGACTDVVVRAFRAAGVDLQVLVHDDVASAPELYGAAPDPNIDHRRITTLHAYFSRNAQTLSNNVRRDKGTFLPGDIVFFAWKRCYAKYPCIPEHVGIVSDRIGPRGLPLVLQNGGPQATESDGLDHGTIVGHFRMNEIPAARPEP